MAKGEILKSRLLVKIISQDYYLFKISFISDKLPKLPDWFQFLLCYKLDEIIPGDNDFLTKGVKYCAMKCTINLEIVE